MPIVPLVGHAALLERLKGAHARGALPASILLAGPRGVGKQRVALWLAQLLLCTSAADAPCGVCQSCRFSLALTHPDLHWYFPRTKGKSETDLAPPQVVAVYGEEIAERVARGGLYEPADGKSGIFMSAVLTLVQQAAMSPAMARRKVFVIGDAERMVPQEGSDQAANAFLKLLEEPLADTIVILTSSEPGALLPTIRSRVAQLRVAKLSDRELQEFVSEPQVAAWLDKADVPKAVEERVRLADGAPGSLLGLVGRSEAVRGARSLIEAATGPRIGRLRAAFVQGSAGARGPYSDQLDELTVALHARTREAVARGDDGAAAATARAMEAVERAKTLTETNVNPQLITAALLRELAGALA